MRATDIIRQRRRRREEDNTFGKRALRLAGSLVLAGLALIVLAGSAGAAMGVSSALIFLRGLPDVDSLPETIQIAAQPGQITHIVARRGEAETDPVWVPVADMIDPRASAGWLAFEELSPTLVPALLAVTDPQFLSSSPPGLGQGILDLILTGQPQQTQSPLVNELIASHLRTAANSDKPQPLQDWFLGWQIEQGYGREQVLEWLFNTGTYGHLTFGVNAAAQVYFGKSATDLSLGEAAMLVAIAQDPAANPFDNWVVARNGQAEVLRAMVEHGIVDEATAEHAAAASLTLADPPGSLSTFPTITGLIQRELEQLLGPERVAAGGLRVETTLDLNLQYEATCAMEAYLVQANDDQGIQAAGDRPPCVTAELLPAITPPNTPVTEVAVVILDPQTGALLAVADSTGGRATAESHELGSLVRPFIYLTALSQGYSGASMLLDLPQDNKATIDKQYQGPISLRQAIASNAAAPITQLWPNLGDDAVTGTAAAFGLSGQTASLPTITQALATISHQGIRAGAPVDTTGQQTLLLPAISRVVDDTGTELYNFTPEEQTVLSPQLAFLMSQMLAGRGTKCDGDCLDENILQDGQAMATMTGRAEENGDQWSVGATSEVAVGVWVGQVGDQPYAELPSSNTAEPLWQAISDYATQHTTSSSLVFPAGIHLLEVCQISGLLPRYEDGPDGAAHCPTVSEYFVAGTEPTAVDTLHQRIAVNRTNGRLATVFTPSELVEWLNYLDFPPEAEEWAATQGLLIAPSLYDPVGRVDTRIGDEAAVSIPRPFAEVSGPVVVKGTAAGDLFESYTLAYFEGLWPYEVVVLSEYVGTPVEVGTLGVWDTSALEAGLYTLLLALERQDGTTAELAIPVTVANE